MNENERIKLREGSFDLFDKCSFLFPFPLLFFPNPSLKSLKS